MLINIPLQIDDAAIEGKLTKEYEAKIVEEVSRRLDNTLKQYDETFYSNSKTPEKGLESIVWTKVDKHIEKFLADHKDEIIEKAAAKLEDRVRRTKKAKEL